MQPQEAQANVSCWASIETYEAMNCNSYSRCPCQQVTPGIKWPILPRNAIHGILPLSAGVR